MEGGVLLFRYFLSLCIVFLTIMIVSTSHVSSQVAAANESPPQSKHCSHCDLLQETEAYLECTKDSDRDDNEILIIQHSRFTDYFYFLLKYLF